MSSTRRMEARIVKPLAALALAGALLAAAAPAASAGPSLILVGGNLVPGRDFLVVLGPPGATVQVDERIGSRSARLATTVLPTTGVRELRRAFDWRCDRRVRRFSATVRMADSALLTDEWATRTPSCADRLGLRLPVRIHRSGVVRARAIDSWRLGTHARLCVKSPKRANRCRRLRVPASSKGAAVPLLLGRRGRWRVALHGPGEVLRQEVLVGVRGRSPPRRLPLVLTVGDSMMDPLDVLLGDGLRGSARTRSFVRVGDGLSHPGNTWLHRARVEARLRPRATVVFLGANDYFDMRTPRGELATCCGPGWVAEYSRRVAGMMRAYARGGRGRVLWLTLPGPGQASRRVAAAGVNAAVRTAAAASGQTVVPLDEVFTPGFAYRAVMPWHGRQVRVRLSDGIHLSPDGSGIAERFAQRALELP